MYKFLNTTYHVPTLLNKNRQILMNHERNATCHQNHTAKIVKIVKHDGNHVCVESQRASRSWQTVRNAEMVRRSKPRRSSGVRIREAVSPLPKEQQHLSGPQTEDSKHAISWILLNYAEFRLRSSGATWRGTRQHDSRAQPIQAVSPYTRA